MRKISKKFTYLDFGIHDYSTHLFINLKSFDRYFVSVIFVICT